MEVDVLMVLTGISVLLSFILFYSNNGGRCIDGINWYLCECVNGFAGPDCRISKLFHINDTF